jgi:hypothetical protein
MGLFGHYSKMACSQNFVTETKSDLSLTQELWAVVAESVST